MFVHRSNPAGWRFSLTKEFPHEGFLTECQPFAQEHKAGGNPSRNALMPGPPITKCVSRKPFLADFPSRKVFLTKAFHHEDSPHEVFPSRRFSPQKLFSRIFWLTEVYTFRVVWGPRARSRKLCLRVPMPRTVMIRHFRVLGGPGRGFSVKGYLPCPRPPDSLSFLFIL